MKELEMMAFGSVLSRFTRFSLFFALDFLRLSVRVLAACSMSAFPPIATEQRT